MVSRGFMEGPDGERFLKSAVRLARRGGWRVSVLRDPSAADRRGALLMTEPLGLLLSAAS
jgi:hypothetical protein